MSQKRQQAEFAYGIASEVGRRFAQATNSETAKKVTQAMARSATNSHAVKAGVAVAATTAVATPFVATAAVVGFVGFGAYKLMEKIKSA